MVTLASQLCALVADHGEMLSVYEAADFLKLAATRVSVLVQKKTIRGFPIGRNTFIPLADLRAWDRLRKSGKAPTGRGHKAQPVYALAV